MLLLVVANIIIVRSQLGIILGLRSFPKSKSMNSLLSKVVYSHCPLLKGVGRWAVVVEVVEYQAECHDASVWEQQTVDWWMEGLHWVER